MLTTITNTCLLLLTFCISATGSTATRQYYYHHRNRHLLHQAFFPRETVPPTQPPTTFSPLPQPVPNPKYPFTTATAPPITEKPFFPTIPSPPPPPVPPSTAIATFPANISSLLLPHQPSSSIHRHVVAIAASISLLCAAVIASISALFIYSRTTRCHSSVPTGAASATAEKTSHSEDSSRLFPPNTAPSDKPPRYTSPNVSSEFLYLGTLVNSRGEIEQQQEKSNKKNSNKSTNTTNTTNVASVKFNVLSSATSSTYQKLGSGSPELKPLPPLPRHNYYSYQSGEAEVKIVSAKDGSERGETEEGDDDNEEFFSPRGSSGHKESPKRHGSSSSRRDFQGIIGVDNFGSRSFSSRTALYPCSNSCSPSNSISSSSQSPVNNAKSPDSVVNFPAPPTMITRSHSSISSSSSSSVSVNNHTSPDRLSVASLQNKQCLEGESGSSKGFVAVKLPPPPPPPPPPRFWEMPIVNSGPPVLVTPSKPVLSTHLANERLGVERREEETPTKPKLKPLHWDKVRASSDRAMVWDQIKCSSFQLNEEMIETLFMMNNTNSNLNPKDNARRQILLTPNQENRVLDPKKSQNIAILLRALNVTVDEVCESLLEGTDNY